MYIYCAGLGVNGDGLVGGDKVKTTSLVLSNNATGIATHQINEANLLVFPNLVSDHIHLSYSVEEKGSVLLQLFNMNGELVADLFNEQQYVGTHVMDRALPNSLTKGVYLVKLSVNGKYATQKILVY